MITRRRIALALAVPLVALVVAAGVVLGPYVRDDLVLDRVVRAVALDWRDFGREAALERLQYELDHQGIGLQVGDDDCALEETGSGRRVACSWSVELGVPASERSVPLAFSSVAMVTEDGDLR